MMVGSGSLQMIFRKLKITLCSTPSQEHKYVMTPQAGNSKLDVTVETPFMPRPNVGGTPEILAQRGNSSATLVRTAQQLSTRRLKEKIFCYTKKITFKRLTKYFMRFSLSDAIANGGIDANVADGPIGELTGEP